LNNVEQLEQLLFFEASAFGLHTLREIKTNH